MTASADVKLVVYAEAGSGKTMLCATMPKPVIISAEAGLLSLTRSNIERVYGAGTPGITYDIPVIQVSNIQQLDEALVMLQQPAMRQHIRSICLDSISEIAEKMLASMKVGSKDLRQAYGETADQTMVRLRTFRDLPGYHVYMSAKQELFKDESGISRFTVSMPGRQLGPQVPYMLDEVFYLGINKTPQGQKYRYLRTDQDLQYVAKDRSGKLNEIEEPHLGKIITKITGATA